MKRPRTRIMPGNGNHGNDYDHYNDNIIWCKNLDIFLFPDLLVDKQQPKLWLNIILYNIYHGNDYDHDYALTCQTCQCNGEPEQWWNWQWHCLNISICQWRIEHISENILLKSVPQRVICSCTAWSVGFTCIKNSTLISKQIFSWGVRRKYWGFSWCSHATMIKITILWYYDVTTQHAGFKFFVQQDSSSLQENTFFF